MTAWAVRAAHYKFAYIHTIHTYMHVVQLNPFRSIHCSSDKAISGRLNSLCIGPVVLSPVHFYSVLCLVVVDVVHGC